MKFKALQIYGMCVQKGADFTTFSVNSDEVNAATATIPAAIVLLWE